MDFDKINVFTVLSHTCTFLYFQCSLAFDKLNLMFKLLPYFFVFVYCRFKETVCYLVHADV